MHTPHQQSQTNPFPFNLFS